MGVGSEVVGEADAMGLWGVLAGMPTGHPGGMSSSNSAPGKRGTVQLQVVCLQTLDLLLLAAGQCAQHPHCLRPGEGARGGGQGKGPGEGARGRGQGKGPGQEARGRGQG